MLAVLLCGCNVPYVEPKPDDDPGNEKTEKHAIRSFELTDAEQQMNVQTNIFALNMLKQIVSSEDLTQKPNICFSPVSANMALGILLGGADGQTRTEMQTVLGFGEATEEQVNAYYHKLVEALPYLDSTTIVTIANALWLKETFPVKDAYKRQTQATFNATIDNVRTFVDDAVIGMINQWAADNTNNLIKKVIDRSMVNESLMMVFANALYFKGIWNAKFEKSSTRQEDFTTAADKTEKKDDEKDKEGKYIRRERYYGSCSRSFFVGKDVTEEDIKAKFENGILKISVPKKEAKPEVEEKKFISIDG